MSIASVSGRNRAEKRAHLLQADPQYLEKLKAARAEQAKTARRFPKPLHRQYMDAWRKAGKPANFPSAAEWRADQT